MPENQKVDIILKQGDITEEPLDAIVNAANSHLQHGGGVAGAILRKGGYVIQEESQEIGFVPVGNAVITSSGRLPCRKVIHTVGPRWGEGDEDIKLTNAVYNALKVADENTLSTIAFPAVSSGIFGFPKDRCARIMLNSVKKYLKENKKTCLKLVEFCIIDDQTINIFKNEFKKILD
ncbi:MAG: macro domain-containing protein [Spirochaetes bacterium]|nr:macro domain-containing protein [Spirochaetota bacterium]